VPNLVAYANSPSLDGTIESAHASRVPSAGNLLITGFGIAARIAFFENQEFFHVPRVLLITWSYISMYVCESAP
jgi:hypothetical protein